MLTFIFFALAVLFALQGGIAQQQLEHIKRKIGQGAYNQLLKEADEMRTNKLQQFNRRFLMFFSRRGTKKARQKTYRVFKLRELYPD